MDGPLPVNKPSQFWVSIRASKQLGEYGMRVAEFVFSGGGWKGSSVLIPFYRPRAGRDLTAFSEVTAFRKGHGPNAS